MVNLHFGNDVEIVATFGNNDYKTHYGFPITPADKQEFYSFTFDRFFTI